MIYYYKFQELFENILHSQEQFDFGICKKNMEKFYIPRINLILGLVKNHTHKQQLL